MMVVETFPIIDFEIDFSPIHPFVWICIVVFTYSIIYIAGYGTMAIIYMFSPILILMIMNIIEYLFDSLLVFKVTIPINILFEVVFFLIRRQNVLLYF